MAASPRSAAFLALISLSASAVAQVPAGNAQLAPPAQEAQNAAPAQQAPVCGPPVANQQQAGAASGEVGQEKKQSVPIAKEVGASAAGTAGQIGGAAVAGPIGAAVGGVIASKVGEAVGSLVKKKKKPPEDKGQQTAEAQAQGGSAQPQIVCVAPTEPQQPQR